MTVSNRPEPAPTRRCNMLFGFCLVVLASDSLGSQFVFREFEPELVPSPISGLGLNGDPELSANGLELYFTSTRTGSLGASDLWMSQRSSIDDPWGEPTRLDGEINSSSAERWPSLSEDGLELYFTRDGVLCCSNDSDIWLSRRDTLSSPWGEPTRLAINVTGARDREASISSDGLELFLDSNRRDRDLFTSEIYVARRPTMNDDWGDPMPLDLDLPEPFFAGGADITTDGLHLFFFSDVEGDVNSDLNMWIASRPTPDAKFETPTMIPEPPNGPGSAVSPTLSPADSSLYFYSNRSGSWDIWKVEVTPPAHGLRAGDADQDLDFDQFDLVRVQQASKYLTGQVATWGEGDWDGAPGGEPGNPPAGNGVFDQNDIIEALAAGVYLSGPYNASSTERARDGTFGGVFGSLSFAYTTQVGLDEPFATSDLSGSGFYSEGGLVESFNSNSVAVPEPANSILVAICLLGFSSTRVQRMRLPDA